VRLRPKRFRASVIVTDTAARPITLTAGPGLQFDLALDETRDLILALGDAYDAAKQRGGES
jgi:hypothetical protein